MNTAKESTDFDEQIDMNKNMEMTVTDRKGKGKVKLSYLFFALSSNIYSSKLRKPPRPANLPL
jgi:hypothetical protein